jgi:hypothetical protein
MKNAVITAKLPSGKWECVFISENITEAKIKYKQLTSSESIEETTKGYLQFNLFYQPQMRRVSKSGRISEAEIKEKAKNKKKSIKDAAKILKDDEAAFEAELKAEEVVAAKEAAAIKKRQKKEREEKAAKKKLDAEMVASKEAAKSEAFAEVVAAKLKGK